MKQVRIGLLSLLVAIFAMAGVAMADSYTYVGSSDYSGAGIGGYGMVYATQISDGAAGSLTSTGDTQLNLNSNQSGIIFNVTGDGAFGNNSGADMSAYESGETAGVEVMLNTTSLVNSGFGVTITSNGVMTDGFARNISGGNTGIFSQSQLDGQVVSLGGWGAGDGAVATYGNAGSGSGGAQVNLGTYSVTSAQSVGSAAVLMNAVTVATGFAS